MLDIHQLHVFLAAAEARSFTQAAQRLHMTQPSVSQHIQALERYFGCELFLRNGRNLELTDAGLALIPLAREAVSLSVRIEEQMASMRKGVAGHLIVGCSTTPGKYVLPQLLARFHERYPLVRTTCHVTSQRQAMQLLADGEVHFALTSLIQERMPGLEVHRFICDRVLLIAPLNHPWAEKGVIEPEELLQARFILREETSGTYAAVREALASVDISLHDLSVLLTLGSSEAIALAVQEGLGVGFVSEKVADWTGKDQVAVIQIRNLEIQREIYISRNVRRPATVVQNVFWSFVFSKDNPLFCEE
jgi:DNA-binding transcriptional LysR family regulator